MRSPTESRPPRNGSNIGGATASTYGVVNGDVGSTLRVVVTASNGTAGHGSTSPWDIHNTLIAAGPDLNRGITIQAPSANVDFAPTFLKLLALTVPSTMQGRPLDEALVRGAASGAGTVRTMEHVARTADGSYAVTGMFSVVTTGVPAEK